MSSANLSRCCIPQLCALWLSAWRYDLIHISIMFLLYSCSPSFLWSPLLILHWNSILSSLWFYAFPYSFSLFIFGTPFDFITVNPDLVAMYLLLCHQARQFSVQVINNMISIHLCHMALMLAFSIEQIYMCWQGGVWGINGGICTRKCNGAGKREKWLNVFFALNYIFQTASGSTSSNGKEKRLMLICT